MNDRIREALRLYERKSWWDAYGRAQAKERRLTEADVIPAIKEVRKEKSGKSAAHVTVDQANIQRINRLPGTFGMNISEDVLQVF